MIGAAIGGLIALAAALVFVVVGLMTVIGGAEATEQQIIPGFRPDNPGLLQRAMTLLGLWGPILVILVFCLLAGWRIFSVVVGAL
ncbi:MAG TPA: hypothetical protein VFT66_03575 [Roseiflexaceae bacterium]|jgi:hypothetical protein|nr:hypothetical protein [Roseiflexaceae bacterium]